MAHQSQLNNKEKRNCCEELRCAATLLRMVVATTHRLLPTPGQSSGQLIDQTLDRLIAVPSSNQVHRSEGQLISCLGSAKVRRCTKSTT